MTTEIKKDGKCLGWEGQTIYLQFKYVFLHLYPPNFIINLFNKPRGGTTKSTFVEPDYHKLY